MTMDRVARVRLQIEVAVRELDHEIEELQAARADLEHDLEVTEVRRAQLIKLTSLEPAVFDHVVAVLNLEEPIDDGAGVATGGVPAPPDPGREYRAPSSFAAPAPDADPRDQYDEHLEEALRHA